MKKILYVNGCSHSAGAELSYVGSNREPYDLKNSWGGIIADRYKLSYINDATSGQSNNSIITSSIYTIFNLLKTYKSSELLIIIGWSSFDRTEYVYEDKLYRFVPGCDQLPLFKKWPKPVQDAFITYIHTSDYTFNMNKFAIEYFTLVNFLKNNKIDYYFFNSIHACFYTHINILNQLHNTTPVNDIFYIIENDDNYLEPFNIDMTYFEYMKKRYNGHEEGRCFHFREPAQIEWANILQEKINKYF